MDWGGEVEHRVEVDPGIESREIAVRALANPLQPHVVRVEDLVEAFLATFGANTRRAYDRDLMDFARFLGVPSSQRAVIALTSSGPGAANSMVLSYRTHLQARKLAPATIGRRLAAIRSVVKLARQVGQVNWEIEIASPKAEAYRDTRGPGDDGWRAIAKASKDRAADGSGLGLRNLAILRVTHDLGLRVSELVGLDLEDLEREGGVSRSVWIRGKGRTQDERLTVPGSTAATLDAWLAFRGEDAGPVFIRLDPAADGARTRLTDRSVRYMVGKVRLRAGVARHVTPHGLRHHAITNALDKTNGDVRKVQRFSRHKDLRTLTVYDDRRKDSAGEVANLVSED